jgi:hypothetical protein
MDAISILWGSEEDCCLLLGLGFSIWLQMVDITAQSCASPPKANLTVEYFSSGMGLTP